MNQQMRAINERAEQPGLNNADVVFYDAVVQNDAAVLQMGDDVHKQIATSLVTTVRENTTIDWSLKDEVRAKKRARIRRLLARHGYRPDN